MTIERTLHSILPYTRQIVMVDTGSVDETPVIGSKNGAEVYYHKWRDNFSEARNYAIKHVNTDWILNIDADEELTTFLKVDAFNDNSMGGINVILKNILKEGNNDYTSAHRYTRIIRNSPDIYFTGRVHEQISHSILGAGLKIFESDIEITHHGYADKDSDRYDRNIGLLIKELEEHPEDGFLMYHLGQSYFAAGKTDYAAHYFGQSLINDGLSQNQQSLATIRLAQIALAADDYDRTLELTKIKFTDEDTDAFRRYVRGAAMLNKGNISEAVNLYKTLLAKKYNYINYTIINQLLSKLDGRTGL